MARPSRCAGRLLLLGSSSLMGISMLLCSVTMVARAGSSGSNAAEKERSDNAAYWTVSVTVLLLLAPGCCQKRNPPPTAPSEFCLPSADQVSCDEAEVGPGERVLEAGSSLGRNSSISPSAAGHATRARTGWPLRLTWVSAATT